MKTINRLSVLMLLMLVGSVNLSAQVAKLYPVDEAAKDPTFFAFRARLFQAIQKKDSAFLLSIVDPAIENNFGGTNGFANFKTIWHPERATSPVWSELMRTLSLGGKFDNDKSYSAPYLFNSFPEKFDAFEHSAIIDDSVRVRKEPNTRSTVIRTLSFDVVKLGQDKAAPYGTSRQWVPVVLADGQKGYVAAEYIRSSIDYRAIFEKKNGKWIMTAFIAGD